MSKGMRGIAKQEKRKKQAKIKPADLTDWFLSIEVCIK
jgi:hypothetical protein